VSFLARLIPHSISWKMILSLTVIMMLGGAAASYVHVRTQEAQLLDAMVIGADQLSGSITSATWHAMKSDQRDAAYQIMQTIAAKQGINRIRIFNKEGRIMFSTMPGDSGQVDKDAEACSICHSSGSPLVKVDVPFRARVYRRPDGGRILGMVTPIYNEPACSDAECHAHPVSQAVLGVVDVSMDLAHVDETITGIKQRVVLISGSLILALSLFTIAFTQHFVAGPITRLVRWTGNVNAANLDIPIDFKAYNELKALAQSFESMRVRLKEALDEINRSAAILETKVEERTEQLRVAHRKLVTTDRMASLGQLAASVAHEINNPLSGVLNLSMLMQRIVREDGIPAERLPEFRRYQAQVVSETARVGRIVQDLLSFSRRSKPQRADVDLNAMISGTITLLNHKLKLMGVTLELRLDQTIPHVRCDGSQIQQVLINLIMNAAEAAQGKSEATVIVETTTDGSSVFLRVRDNGEGIKPEHRQRIFEPFFTTKGEGKGVGLGLAVVYGVVEAHQGSIDVESEVGKGTQFCVQLPIRSSDPEEGQLRP
jgi:two-component system NtrC family sensor kinase